MADKKPLSPFDELTRRHADGIVERKRLLDDATEELKTAEAMVREARLKIAQLQQANLTASLAYDDQVAELRKTSAKAA